MPATPTYSVDAVEKMAAEADRTELSAILRTVIREKSLYNNIVDYSMVLMIISKSLMLWEAAQYTALLDIW
jgi:hypothetical protein